MARLIPTPTRIPAHGQPPKIIEEFIGRVNSKTSAVSVARMISPSGWSEPGQTPEFDEFTIVEGGSKRRRGGIVAAVENGGAHWCIFGRREDSVSRYLAQLRREAQECDPTWSFGKKFVGEC